MEIRTLKQAVADYRTQSAKAFELREQRDAAWQRARELRNRTEKAQSAVERAKELLGEAQADYAATGDFAPVDAAMRALAVAQAEADVAVKTVTPMIERENEAAHRLERDSLIYEPRLPHAEAAAHLLNTSADVRLFLYLYREAKLPLTNEVLRYRLEYSEESHKPECEKAFEKLMAKA